MTINQDCIDNDQVVMWQGAKDFSNGIFHVPLYYGQDYNTMFEALIAVPLVLCKTPIYWAVPIATHILFIFPFLFSAFYLFKNKFKYQAIFVLAILLCLPVGFDIMTSIPRGFVTGLFFTSFFIISVHNPNSFKWLAINTFFGGLAYIFNPNSLVVSAPLLSFLFLFNYKNKKYYLVTFASLSPVILLLFYIKYFYSHYESPLVYGLTNEFSIAALKDSIANIGKRFMHVSFFGEGYSGLSLLIIITLAISFFNKNIKIFLAFLAFLLIIFISLCTSKSADGAEWAFYSYSRLYIGIPIFIYLFISLLELKKVIVPIIVITLIFSFIKAVGFKEAINYHSQEKKWNHLNLISLRDLKECVNTYTHFAHENKTTHFIVDHVWRDDFLNYASEVINPDFPLTFKPSYERRSWLITENKERVIERFLIIIRDPKQIEDLNNSNIFKLDDYGLYLVTNNKKPLSKFLNTINCSIYYGN